MNDHQEPGLGRISSVVTNLIKLGGLVLVFHDAFTDPPGLDPATLAVAAFMMAGAQGIDSFLQNFFGGSQK